MVYTVCAEESGRRLDSLLADVTGASRSAVVKWLDEGLVSVEGKKATKNLLLAEGDLISYEEPEPVSMEAKAEDIPLSIVYEDEALLVINKPSGMVVHPAPGNTEGTLVNALLHHCAESLSGIGGVLRPGIVHRIDKDTSGLLVVAKTDAAHRHLAAQLEDHSLYREYHALLCGGLKEDKGTVSLPIGRHPVDRKKMAVITDGLHSARPAVTHYEVIERFAGFCYVKLRLQTGRTHQIRVHMASLGHPVMGDTVYGGGSTPWEKRHASLLDGQMLHAKKISFTHPCGKPMTLECPLPENFERALSLLREK
ncbi:MAG: RluA family pseudouridine synthase [Clostridia bacterium]|nr:RluA family pseudouridine synthase [Clostridia bacterium]